MLQTVVLEKTLENLLYSKEIKPVNPKGNQPWMFTGSSDAEVLILWPPDVKSHSLEKTLMLGKTEGMRRIGWQRMRWLHGITDSTDMSLSKLQRTVKGQGSLASCSPQCCRDGYDLATDQRQQLCKTGGQFPKKSRIHTSHTTQPFRNLPKRRYKDL